MLFYFSATGNTKYVVSQIALPDETVVFIPDAVKNGDYKYAITDGRLGIITPTYDWTLPSIVSEFLEKVTITPSDTSDQIKPYIFYVGTFGTTTGAASVNANEIMKKKGFPFDAMFDVRMPDTWTPMFDLSDKEKVLEQNRKADEEIRVLKVQLEKRLSGKHMDLTMPGLIGKGGKLIYDNYTRKTDHFTVLDSCIGCGLCVRKCPVQAIEIKDKRPVWVKDKCVMCLGCLHRCPKFAIQYGGNTRKHSQYVNPHVKV